MSAKGRHSSLRRRAGARRCRRGRWRARRSPSRPRESGVALATGAELCIHLADDARDARAQRALARAQDKPTNVLSFPAAAPAEIAKARLLGDIVLAFETVAREAADEGKPLADHYRHLVVHGFLHLIGLRPRRRSRGRADGGARKPHPGAARRRRPLSRRRSGGRSIHDRARRRRARPADRARTAAPTRARAACSSGCGPCSASSPPRSATTSRTRWRRRRPTPTSRRRSARCSRMCWRCTRCGSTT